MDPMPCLSDGGMDWGKWKSECPNEDCRAWHRKCAKMSPGRMPHSPHPTPHPHVLQQQFKFVTRQQHVVPDGFKCIGQQGGMQNGGICINHATKQVKKIMQQDLNGWWRNEKKVLKTITDICKDRPGLGLACGNVIQLAQQNANTDDPWVILPYLTVNTQPLDLAKALSGHGPSSSVLAGFAAPDVRLAIKNGIWAGVETLHKMGWVHNDIKPGNIFLTDDNGNSAIRAVIGDLGGSNKIGMQRGPFDMAYAHARQNRQCLKENDWFACVLCVYDMLCGHLTAWPPHTNVGEWDKVMQVYAPQTLLSKGPYTSLQAV